jgi:hypothetical protein
MSNGGPVAPVFDPDNEGHPGWRDDQMAGAVYGWLDTLDRVGSAPDILLLHIGTNGLDEDPGDVERILDEIDRFERSANRPVKVVLARIIPKANSAANLAMTTRFNDNVTAMAEARDDDIVIVDMESALVPADLCDGVHPNSSGYTKMAAVWYQALSLVLPPPSEHPSKPVIVSHPPATAQVGAPYVYQVRAANSPTRYSLLEAPAGMAVSSTGLISWTPDWTGPTSVVVETENAYATDTQTFTIHVAPSSLDPSGTAVYSSGGSVGYYLWRESGGAWKLRLNSDGLRRNLTGTISSSGTIRVQPFSLESNDSLTVAGGLATFNCWLSNSHDGVDFQVDSGATLTFDLLIDGQRVPALVFVGSALASPGQVPFTIIDGGGSLPPQDVPPLITSTPSTTAEAGSAYSYRVQATGSPAPGYALITSPPGMTIDAASGMIVWTPQAGGSFGVIVEASNTAGSHRQSFTIVVSQSPAPGDLDPSGAAVYESGRSVGYYLWRESGGTWRLRLNSDGLRRNLSGTIVSSGTIQGWPFSLESNDSLTVSEGKITFNCWMSNSHDGIDFRVDPGAVVTFDLRVGGAIDPSRVFVGSVLANPAQVPFSIVDGGGALPPQTTPPVITSTPPTSAEVGAAYGYDVQATGSPAPAFALLSAPAGMSIDAASGLIAWTPQSGGSYGVIVEASNAEGVDTQPFTIVVGEPPAPAGLDPAGTAVYESGKSVGYYLWRESSGLWKLRLNSDGLRRNLSGTIVSTGQIQAVPFSLESNDSLTVSGKEVAFNCWLSSSHDGIDFRVGSGDAVTFDLRVGGASDPSLIFVGASSASPAAMPFSLRD